MTCSLQSQVLDRASCCPPWQLSNPEYRFTPELAVEQRSWRLACFWYGVSGIFMRFGGLQAVARHPRSSCILG
jgi:hypothetical protein